MLPGRPAQTHPGGNVLGLIVNPRGVGGSGKTELARRLLADYGWARAGRAEPLRRAGRERPIGYRIAHPLGGRPLVVLGHYERTSGGCDTIPLADGGLDEIFRLADAWAAAGHDVFFEGAAASVESERSARLARAHRLHVLVLTTPAEEAARNLAARRHAGRSVRPGIAATATARREAIEAACRELQGRAAVEHLGFAGALRRSRELLGLRPAAEGPAPPLGSFRCMPSWAGLPR